MQIIMLFFWTLSFLSWNCSDSKQSLSADAAISDSQFRVASYNIRYRADADEASGNGWDLRKGPLAKLIVSHEFDLVGTQEGYDSQLEDLKSLMPGFSYVGHRYGGDKVKHNCAIFYKTSLFEVLDSGVFWLSETPDVPSIGWDANDQRICQWIKFKVKKTGKSFYFFNAHFYWRLKIAKEESGPLMARKIKEIAGDAPLICTGDFNSTVETPQIIAIKKVLSDAYDITKKPREGVENTNMSGGVFQGQPVNRIDYIFLSRHFTVEDYKVISDMYNDNRYPSDHLPVTSLLTF